VSSFLSYLSRAGVSHSRYCPKKEVTLNRIGVIRLNIAKDVHEAKSGQIEVSNVLYSINDK